VLALAARGPEEARASLSASRSDLVPALEMLVATESFSPGEGAFDGCVAPEMDPALPISVTALEAFGRCPLQFFFRRVLRVRPLEEEATPFALDPRSMGLLAHDVLEAVYRRLPVDDAREAVAAEWQRATEGLARRVGGRVPVLWEVVAARWLSALQAFVEEDLESMSAQGFVSLELEQDRVATIGLGEGVELALRGRFDRVAKGRDDLVVVGDYKSGADLARHVDAATMLRGFELQGPLYRQIAGAGAAVDFLGVGPRHDPPHRERFSGFPRADQEAGFRESLRVVIGVLRSGRFPLRRDPERCPSCDYRTACRYNHPPTLDRHDRDPATRTLRLVRRKTLREPLLPEDRR
jgi:RecB family exonuclease